MTSEQKKILLTGLAMGLILKGSWHRIDPNKFDNEWPVEFSWSGIRENPAFRASITTNPFYKISDLTVTAAELKALAITAEGSELTLTASSEKEGYSMGMFYNATADTTITILCITDLDTANASGGFNAPATGLYVRYTADPDGAKYSVAKAEAAETALYLYGHPDEGGNVAVRSGDAVTVYDGGVLPDIYTVYTPELQAQYPYVSLSYASLKVLRALRFSASPSYREDGKVKWFVPAPYMSCGLNSATDYTEWKEPTLSEKTEDYQLTLGVWANHDIYNVDGTLFQATSEPIPIYNGVVAYLYNGVELPELPEWDKEAYPYAFIQFMDAEEGPWYRLICASVQPYKDSIMPLVRWSDGLHLPYSCLVDGDSWVLGTVSDTSGGFATDSASICWSNFDIMKVGNETEPFLAATSPIPIYE